MKNIYPIFYYASTMAEKRGAVMQRGWIFTIPEPRGFWDYFPRLAPIPEGIPGVRGLGDFPGDPRQIHSRPLWP